MAGTTDANSSPDGEKLLAELQTLLEKQVSLARNGKPEEVASLVERVDELLAELSARASLQCDDERCECIRRLHNELRLTLTAQKSELAEGFKKMQVGRNSLRAYGDAASSR